MFYVEEKKMMNSLAKENKTNHIFHRMFTDHNAKECAGGGGKLPKREGEGKKLKPSALTFAKEREHCSDRLEIAAAPASVHTTRPATILASLCLPWRLQLHPEAPRKRQLGHSDSWKERG